MKLVITRGLAHLSRLLQPKKAVKHALVYTALKRIYTALKRLYTALKRIYTALKRMYTALKRIYTALGCTEMDVLHCSGLKQHWS